MYPPELVAPMKADLTSKGYTELFTAEDVDATLIEVYMLQVLPDSQDSKSMIMVFCPNRSVVLPLEWCTVEEVIFH